MQIGYGGYEVNRGGAELRTSREALIKDGFSSFSFFWLRMIHSGEKW
jgi:hypothetical protein